MTSSNIPETYPPPRSFRLDSTARALLAELHEKLGVSQADIVRLAIRTLAEKEGVTLNGKKKKG